MADTHKVNDTATKCVLNDTCFSANTGCATCDKENKCLTCEEGFIKGEDIKCDACGSNCKTCSEATTASKCLTCKDGFTHSGVEGTDGTCTKVNAGYDGECVYGSAIMVEMCSTGLVCTNTEG